MPTDADFLAAVIADPDADGPRLIYADWLEENGADARAEFIRVQCALADVNEDDAHVQPLSERGADLLNRHYDQWVQPLNSILFAGSDAQWWQPLRSALSSAVGIFGFGETWLGKILDRTWRFRRGFAEKLHVPASAFLPRAAELMRATPLRSLVVQLSASAGLAELASAESLRVLRSLSIFGNGEEPAHLDRLLASEHIGGVQRFGLQNLNFDQIDIDRLAQSALLQRLERLTIVATVRGPGERLASLLAALPADSLDRLSLGGLWNDTNATETLRRFPRLQKLTQLDLPGNGLGDADLEGLLDRLPALTHLNLADTGLTDVGLRSIARSSGLRRLRWLDLSQSVISDQSALDLIDSPSLLATTRLNLRDCSLSEPVQRALRVRLGDRVLL